MVDVNRSYRSEQLTLCMQEILDDYEDISELEARMQEDGSYKIKVTGRLRLKREMRVESLDQLCDFMC